MNEMPPELKARHVARALEAAKYGRAGHRELARAMAWHDAVGVALLEAYIDSTRRPIPADVMAEAQRYQFSLQRKAEALVARR